MNLMYPQFPCLTPLTRIASNGDESILSNLTNGKWVRVSNQVLACFTASNAEGVTANLLHITSPEEAEKLLTVLAEHDFIDSGEGKSYPEKLVLFPNTAYLNVTNYCNLTCEHCYYGSHPGLSHGLPNSEMFKIIDSLRAAEISYLVIAGGEPLTRPGIDDLLRYVRAKNFHEATLLTNGTIHSDDLASVVAKCVDNIHVSVDGPDEESNAVLRGTGNFDRALAGIRRFRVAGASRIKIVTSITSFNVSRMHEMRRLRDELGVELGTTIFAEVGRGSQYIQLKPPTEELARFFLEEAKSLNCDSSVADGPVLDVSAGVTCGSGTLMVSVDCFGDVFPCHLFHKPELRIGNLLSQPDLREMMLSSAVAAQFRARTVETRKCHGCAVEHFCKGGCLAHTVAAHDDSENPWIERDPFCEVHESVLSAQLWPDG